MMHVKPPRSIELAAGDTETILTESGIVTRQKLEIVLPGTPEKFAINIMAASTLSEGCEYFVVAPGGCLKRPKIVRL